MGFVANFAYTDTDDKKSKTYQIWDIIADHTI